MSEIPEGMSLIQSISDIARLDGEMVYIVDLGGDLGFAAVFVSGTVLPLGPDDWSNGLGEAVVEDGGLSVRPLDAEGIADPAGVLDWVRRLTGEALPIIRERVSAAREVQARLSAGAATSKED